MNPLIQAHNPGIHTEYVAAIKLLTWSSWAMARHLLTSSMFYNFFQSWIKWDIPLALPQFYWN